MTSPRIGVTLGDPGGVGPEVVLKALTRELSLRPASYILFGDPRTVAETTRVLGLNPGITTWQREASRGPGIFLAEVEVPGTEFSQGGVARENGEASFLFFEAAVAAAREGYIDALVTAPISKAAWGLAGRAWRGHTEYLESLYPSTIMSFWADKLKIALFSHHVPLKNALEKIKKDALINFLRTLVRSVERLRGGPREFLVAGLNPHAGEAGLLGSEDDSEIKPAVEVVRAEGAAVSGPYPADSVFRRALGRPETMAVALYHDQGLIPFKLEAFEVGVNVTLGLPFARTSPDHGTAFDIAGRGAADPRSMAEALRLAWRFTVESASG